MLNFFLTAEMLKGHWNQSQRNKDMDNNVISKIHCETGILKPPSNLLCLRCFLIMCKSVVSHEKI